MLSLRSSRLPLQRSPVVGSISFQPTRTLEKFTQSFFTSRTAHVSNKKGSGNNSHSSNSYSSTSSQNTRFNFTNLASSFDQGATSNALVWFLSSISLGSLFWFTNNADNGEAYAAEKQKEDKIIDIKNIFAEQDKEFNSLGSGKNNPQGLKLQLLYNEDKQEVFAFFIPNKNHVAFGNITHNGVLSTVSNEVAFWTLFMKTKRIGILEKEQIDYRIPTPVNARLLVRGKVERETKTKYAIRVVVTNEREDILLSGLFTYRLGTSADTKKHLGNAKSKIYEDYI